MWWSYMFGFTSFKVYTEHAQTLFYNCIMLFNSLFFLQTVLISSNMPWIIVQLQLTVARWLLWPASSRLLRNPSIGSGYRSSGLSGLWRSSHHLGLSFDFQKTFSEVIASLAPIIFLVQTVSSGDYIKMRVRLFNWAFVWSLKYVFFSG